MTSQFTSLYSLRCFLSQHVFSLWRHRIIFTCLFQNTCSHATCLYRLRWFLSEHVFSYWKLVSFLAVLFRTRVPRLQVCIVLAGFCRSTCSYTGSSEYLFSYWPFVPFTLGVFRSAYSHVVFFWGIFGASFLILAVCIALAAFLRACVPRSQVCIVFSRLISK